jgi:hypothetical protein
LGGQPGFYPGLNAAGNVYQNGTLTAWTHGQSFQAARPHLIDNSAAMLLDGNYLVPEYMVCPADPLVTEDADGSVDARGDVSYAFLRYDHPELLGEWSETMNASAVVLADRALQGTEQRPESYWGEPGDAWTGTMVRNDGSTSFEQSAAVANLQYHPNPHSPNRQPASFDTPNLFAPQKGAAIGRGQLFWD